MKFLLKSMLLITCIFILPGCCTIEPTFCDDQIFTETIDVPLKFTYVVNSSKPFIEAQKITAQDVKKALHAEGNDFKVTNVELVSGVIQYSKDPANAARTLYVNLGVVASGGGLEFLLLKENQVLPVSDIPAIPFITPGLKINEFLNGQGIKELKKIVKDYATVINDGNISFLLRGEGLPSNSLIKFNLNIELNLSVTYEVCRYGPMFEGGRFCSQ